MLRHLTALPIALFVSLFSLNLAFSSKIYEEYPINGEWTVPSTVSQNQNITLRLLLRLAEKQTKPTPSNRRSRSKPLFKRYQKQVSGHHVQVDVKFLFFNSPEGQRIKRFQYTAIDDATRIRALKIYERHNQANAIDFINYVVSKFPFRIKTIRTDNGHNFNQNLIGMYMI